MHQLCFIWLTVGKLLQLEAHSISTGILKCSPTLFPQKVSLLLETWGFFRVLRATYGVFYDCNIFGYDSGHHNEKRIYLPGNALFFVSIKILLNNWEQFDLITFEVCVMLSDQGIFQKQIQPFLVLFFKTVTTKQHI